MDAPFPLPPRARMAAVETCLLSTLHLKGLLYEASASQSQIGQGWRPTVVE